MVRAEIFFLFDFQPFAERLSGTWLAGALPGKKTPGFCGRNEAYKELKKRADSDRLIVDFEVLACPQCRRPTYISSRNGLLLRLHRTVRWDKAGLLKRTDAGLSVS
jgi:hypothetical protein